MQSFRNVSMLTFSMLIGTHDESTELARPTGKRIAINISFIICILRLKKRSIFFTGKGESKMNLDIAY